MVAGAIDKQDIIIPIPDPQVTGSPDAGARVGKQKCGLKVLMLDTEGIYFDWQSKINQTGRHWDILRTDDVESMLSFLEQSRYHVIAIVSSQHIHQSWRCLVKARALQPIAVRVQLPGMPMSEQQHELSLNHAHKVFSDHSTIEETARTLEYLVKINRLLNKQAIKSYLHTDSQLPTPPAIYEKLNSLLGSEQSSTDQISHIVSQDPALVATILKLVNSASFGLRRQISNIKDAVTLLGIRHLRALALSGHLTHKYPQNGSWSLFSFEHMNLRSLLVARLAHQLCVEQKASKIVQDQAFLAALLHNIGHLILASRDPAHYQSVMKHATEHQIGICCAEKQLLGIYHGEAAAYLLNKWNLPNPVVEVALLHHTPQLSADTEFSPLTAVHIADAVIPATSNGMNTDLSNRLSKSYLQRLGIDKRIKDWKGLIAQYRQMGQSLH
ncbi:HDOD domain-containing protein [Motiliproteus sp. MSK22-1]|uniref:HDOD domain-containing protein n=1 Tax=Motiliproteus sp. MSK22-1 TaxID=1897630 RepID=UPI00117DEF2D|nr:HDOD domain-containing protein [Motiliproteus sp. MSK22-1]